MNGRAKSDIIVAFVGNNGHRTGQLFFSDFRFFAVQRTSKLKTSFFLFDKKKTKNSIKKF